MQTISEFMAADHARCDQLYADGESELLAGNFEEGRENMTAFDLGMRRHFEMEEEILFPAFEQATGMTQGPTMVMRAEHTQMNAILEQMEEALESGDTDTILGAGETLLMMMQQHNMKEEGMLYPMADQHLAEQAANLIQRMREVE
ncbi:MAG: hemerythrin domain-containing protein [SAR324 cluster bacterium]|nr:hemerythrin domain-containing protein [SAR324 cluster bacterium]MBL7034473.1 hemerythrin domain-containing protein [SAR324 cluster bacterium]